MIVTPSEPVPAVSGDSPASGSPLVSGGWMSSDALCKRLGVSRSTLDRMVRAGEIPGRVMIGRQARWSVVVVEDWLRKRMTGLDAKG